MKSFRVDVFGPTTPGAKLRLFGPDGRVIDERPYSAGAAEEFARQVRRQYESQAPNLPDIGRRLFEWLDDSARHWLSRTESGADGLALHLDLRGNLADLPWELLRDANVYCCGLPARLFTPVRRVRGTESPQGDVARAMELWQESVDIEESIGNLGGKAATLANMAWAAGQQGDSARELELNLEAVRALGAARAWTDLVTVLGNLGAGDGDDSVGYLAQAAWLLLRVTKSVERSVIPMAALLPRLGADSEAGPLLAAATLHFAGTRGEKDPKQEEMQQLALRMAAACAAARNIGPERFEAWVKEELLDPAVWLPKLEACLTQLVGADENWLFDRELLPKLAPGD